MSNPFKAAVVQAAPLLFDIEKTLVKVKKLVGEAAQKKAQLVLFPEAFVSVYPRGLGFGTVVGSRTDTGRATWERLWESSIDVPGQHTKQLGEIAKKAGVFLVIGVNEKDAVSGTLYCAMLYFNPKGELMGKHRKIKPTAAERIVWGEGDGNTLSTFDTDLGRMGGLICWENYMPLARMAMYQKGVQIYLAPTADSRESWQHTMRHIAMEGRCYVLGCNQFVTKAMYPQNLPGIEDLEAQPEVMSRGGSVIVSPMGEVLAGPLWDEEGILFADIDLSLVTQSKLDFDVIGHYSRPDIFRLDVMGQPALRKNVSEG